MDETKWYLNNDPNRGGWVYEVIDTREPTRIRYVGKTQVSIKERQAGHWYDAKRTPKRTNSRMVNWLLKRIDKPETVEFQDAGFYPTLEELNDAETQRISYRRSQGMADLNIAHGGEGRAGVPWSEETRAKMREAQPRGEDHPNAKYTWDLVRHIRSEAQRTYTPREEMSRKYGITLSNLDRILYNTAWVDPEYDPSKRVPPPPRRPEDNGRSEVTWADVQEIRRARSEKWESLESVARRYGLKKSAVGYILSGKTWRDPDFDPSTIKKRGDR